MRILSPSLDPSSAPDPASASVPAHTFPLILVRFHHPHSTSPRHVFPHAAAGLSLADRHLTKVELAVEEAGVGIRVVNVISSPTTCMAAECDCFVCDSEMLALARAHEPSSQPSLRAHTKMCLSALL